MTIVYCFEVKVVVFLYKKVVAYVAKVLFFALHYVALSHWSYVSNGISQVKSAIKRAKIICYKSQLLTD